MKAARPDRSSMLRRCFICRAAAPRRRALRPWRSASRKVCSGVVYHYTRPRKSRGTPVAKLAGTQISAGIAAAEIEAASRMYLGVLREAMTVLERGEPFTKQHQVQGKRNCAFAAHLAMVAAQRLYNEAGGRVLYTDNELQRKFRDVQAAAAHHSLNWRRAAEEFGRHVLDAEQ